MHILVIDDDPEQIESISKKLAGHFNVIGKDNSPTTFNYIASNTFDAIIVDAHMPIINGFQFIETLLENKYHNGSPLFMISHDFSSNNRINGLKLKIKDFLTHNYSQEEMILRIKNHLSNDKKHIIGFGNLSLDKKEMRVFHLEKKLDLTLIEYKILCSLLDEPETIVSRQFLASQIWDDVLVSDKTINTHLTNLRNKIQGSGVQIVSHKGKGIVITIKK